MSNNPYADFISFTRSEGAFFNDTGLEIADVVSISPIKLRIDGTDISQSIYKLNGISLAVGDDVAIYRIGEKMTIILGKVVSA